MGDALAFVLDGNDSDISNFSSDEEDGDDETYDQNKVKLKTVIWKMSLKARLSVEVGKNDHAFRWRKKDLPYHSWEYALQNEANIEDLTPVQYFKFFWSQNVAKQVIFFFFFF